MVQKTGIIVQKKNYTLRTWQTEDAASLAQYLNNKNIWDNCRDGLPYPYSQEDANVFLAMVQAKENIQDFCIEVNGEAVGSIGFVPATDVERFSAEVGYWIGEPFWNQGIVTDALKEAINYYPACRGCVHMGGLFCGQRVLCGHLGGVCAAAKAPAAAGSAGAEHHAVLSVSSALLLRSAGACAV